MLDRIENLARSGAKDAARRLLEELQSMLENLQMARPGQQQDGDDDAFDPARFVDGLAALDAPFAERLARARRDGRTLRYVARIGPRSLKVGIEAGPAASPMGGPRGTANQGVIHSRRYSYSVKLTNGKVWSGNRPRRASHRHRNRKLKVR